MNDRPITLFHAPHTRSSGTLRLLEEMGVPYRLHVLDLAKGEHKRPDYLAINPMGKVPALRHGEAIVSEQGAIALYLGDLFPDTGLCPRPDDPLRADLLRWLFFYGDCVEPAVLQKAMGWEAPKASAAGYGSYEDTVAAVVGQLAKGPWFLGERFTVADGVWGSALTWLKKFGLIPATPEIAAYVERFAERPAAARVAAIDAELAAKQKGA
ncbi:MAG: glutathione S-transferase family protein [Phyllobacteriaceae bacterium]|nr:glutathione S-transferase family protein [Phyllobacteriaceae bacterium]